MILLGLWTWTHFYTVIPAFIVFIIAAFVVGKLMKNKSEKIKYIPLQVITVLLLGLEVGKQIVSLDGGYNMYSLPFHYCSLFLYLLPLHSFYRGRFRAQVGAVSFACLSSLFFFMLVMPAIVYSDAAIKEMGSSFMQFHTVVFHNLVCLYFLLVVAMRLYDFRTKRDLTLMAGFLGVYVVVAAILAHTLKVNFHNLYQCNLGFVEEIRLSLIEAIGWPAQLIYVSAIFVLTILFAYLAYFITKGVLRLIYRKSV